MEEEDFKREMRLPHTAEVRAPPRHVQVAVHPRLINWRSGLKNPKLLMYQMTTSASKASVNTDPEDLIVS